jgi:hypothetical protein
LHIQLERSELAMAVFEGAQEATYSVAWIDCLGSGRSLGRSIVMLGEHAKRDELDPARAAAPLASKIKRTRSVPVDFPNFALNRWTVSAIGRLPG